MLPGCIDLSHQMSLTMAEAKAEEARRLRKLLEEMLNSGQPSLDEESIKEVKKICKADQV